MVELGIPAAFEAPADRRKSGQQQASRQALAGSASIKKIRFDVMQVQQQTLAVRLQNGSVGSAPEVLDYADVVPALQRARDRAFKPGEAIDKWWHASHCAYEIPNSPRGGRLRVARQFDYLD